MDSSAFNANSLRSSRSPQEYLEELAVEGRRREIDIFDLEKSNRSHVRAWYRSVRTKTAKLREFIRNPKPEKLIAQYEKHASKNLVCIIENIHIHWITQLGCALNMTAFKPISWNYGAIDHRTDLINSTLARIALANLQGNFKMSNPDRLECDIRLCARVTRNLTVTNGTFDASVSNDIELEGVPGWWDADQQARKGTGIRDYYTFNITGDHPTFPGNHSLSYHVIDIEGVKNYLYDIFTSSYEGASDGDISPYYWPLMNSSDHAKTVAAISQSMSYAMAQAPSGETLEEEHSSRSCTFRSSGRG